MCELCNAFEKAADSGPRNLASILFDEECRARDLDPEAIPLAAQLLIGVLSHAVEALGFVVAGEPGLMKYYAAALTTFARVSDDHADKTFEKITEQVFGADGPTAPDAPPPRKED